MAGYHKVEIPKGVLGEFSKIEEEILELKDAASQNCNVLVLCELCDLLGAIEAFTTKQFNITLRDLTQFKNLTKQAFESGKR